MSYKIAKGKAMRIAKFLLMLIAGTIAVAAAAYVVDLINHYEFLCAGPLVIGGAGGGAIALSRYVAPKKEISLEAALILALLVGILGFIVFEHFEYMAWRARLIQLASEKDAQFANLPITEKERILDRELETLTGHTGYLSYLMFPYYDLDLEIEIVEGAEIPFHLNMREEMAIAFRFIITFLETFAACGGAVAALEALGGD